MVQTRTFLGIIIYVEFTKTVSQVLPFDVNLVKTTINYSIPLILHCQIITNYLKKKINAGYFVKSICIWNNFYYKFYNNFITVISNLKRITKQKHLITYRKFMVL